MPDAIDQTRKLVAEVEERLILSELSKVQQEIDELKLKVEE
jgi:hypothetical protein